MTLLTRDEFRERVFERDGHHCVHCGAPAVDAHHLMERRLFEDGGYYLDNGVSLCEQHHLDAEKTILSPHELRRAAGIRVTIVPPCLTNDIYDKWGNLILPDGSRVAGPLYFDESVQKIIPNSVRFIDRIKYPRTFHLPWSAGVTSDDKVISTLDELEGHEVVITEKMDGENTSLYRDGTHARSLTSAHHPSRDWLKAWHASIAHDIPEGYRICGENLYAEHSIRYEELPSYFLGFSMWQGNRCLSWDETLEWFELIGITPVPTIWRGASVLSGIFDKEVFRKAYMEEGKEGYVVRRADSFMMSEFPKKVAKYVRPNHVQTDTHWLHQEVVPNKLAT